MKIIVTLNGSGRELAREEIEVTDRRDPQEAANLAIHDAIEPWILSPGDTITIREA